MRDFTSYSSSKTLGDINDHSKARHIFFHLQSNFQNVGLYKCKLQSNSSKKQRSKAMEISHFYLMGQSICNSSLTLSCSLLPLQQLGLNLFNRSHTITPSFLCKSEIDIRHLASLTKLKLLEKTNMSN